MWINPTNPRELAPPARLLALAEAEVRRMGAKRARLVDIAEAAGMTHANIYRYFPSKADLVDAITAAWLKPLEADLADLSTASDPAADKLERMLLTLGRAYRDRLEAEPALFEIFVEAVSRSRAVARKHRARLRGAFDRVWEESGQGQMQRVAHGPTLLFDASWRFIDPAALWADRQLERTVYDRRFLATIQASLGLLFGRLRED